MGNNEVERRCEHDWLDSVPCVSCNAHARICKKCEIHQIMGADGKIFRQVFEGLLVPIKHKRVDDEKIV